MSYNKTLMLACGILVTALTSSNAYAVNCSTSYYCYRSMTPGPAPESNQALVRRTAAASNRLNRVSTNNRRPQTAATRNTTAPRPTAPRATPRTQAERIAEARRREQLQQRRLAAQRLRARQQEQQRLAAVQRRRQQAQQQANQAARSTPAQPANRAQHNQPANPRDRLITEQRNAYLAEQRRLAAQRRNQQQAAQRRNQQQAAANRTTPARPATPPARPSVITSASQAQQSCRSIQLKIASLNRQAVLRSREQQHDQAQRLFKAVEQLRKEATNKKCPNIS